MIALMQQSKADEAYLRKTFSITCSSADMSLGLSTLFENFFGNNRCTYEKRIIRE